MAHDDTTAGPDEPQDGIDAELADLLTDADPLVPVVLLVPNGMVRDGKQVMMPMMYQVTATTLMHAQALLERGSTTDVVDVVARAASAVAGVVEDPDLAEQVAAHLAELDLLK